MIQMLPRDQIFGAERDLGEIGALAVETVERRRRRARAIDPGDAGSFGRAENRAGVMYAADIVEEQADISFLCYHYHNISGI